MRTSDEKDKSGNNSFLCVWGFIHVAILNEPVIFLKITRGCIFVPGAIQVCKFQLAR